MQTDILSSLFVGLAILILGCHGTDHSTNRTSDFSKWVDPIAYAALMEHSYSGTTGCCRMVQVNAQTRNAPLFQEFESKPNETDLKRDDLQPSSQEKCQLNINLKKPFKTGDWSISSHLIFNKGSYVVSPNDTHNMKGRFQLSIEDNPFVQLAGLTTEWPSPARIIEPFDHLDISVAKLPTIYRQSLKIESSENFTVKGEASFVLEPSCIFYRLEFELSQSQGVLELKCQPLRPTTPPKTI